MTFGRAIAALACALVSGAANASTLLVTSDLGEIATVGGARSFVASGTGTWSDIAIDSEGRVFATDGGALYRIRDGRADFLGEHAFLNGLAFDPDGYLYGIGGDTLYRLSRSTGKHKAVGSIGGDFVSSGDITFDDEGRLWAVSAGGCSSVGDCLYRVSANSGMGRYVGDLGQRFVYGLAVDDGELVGLTDDARLLRINRRNGASRVTGRVALEGFATGLASFTIEVDPPAPPPPPVTPTPIPLPASGILLIGAVLGTIGLRRNARPVKGSHALG